MANNSTSLLYLSVMILQVAGLLLVASVPRKKRGKESKQWTLFRRIVGSCKFDGGRVEEAKVVRGCKGSLCNLRDVVHGNRRVMHKGETSPQNTNTSLHPHSTGMHLRRWSGCYECHMIVDPIDAFSRDSFRTISSCPSCGEIFTNTEALQHHQIIKHAVSEVDEVDSARNVVEIIFQSSWLKMENSKCKIERILKVHNRQKSVEKFEEYRDTVKAKANKVVKKHARCIADGNELLRFHGTTFSCSLGMNGSSSLCTLPCCNICNIIKNGFCASGGKGIYTTASSGRAHDRMEEGKGEGEKAMAMFVCRVIAGRVHKSQSQSQDTTDDFVGAVDGFDSVAVAGHHPRFYSNLEDLFVYNPNALLPCFVVIYKPSLSS